MRCGPPQVRKEKPRVSAFISADVPKILALKPDLVLTFSDLQADIVAELIRANVAVHAFNQRDVAGIFDMIRTLGALVGAADKAEALASSLAARVDAVHERALRLPRRPRVYFEEWDEPMISGLGWVSELIEAAGGIEVFPQLAARKNAKDRIVSADDVIAAAPDIIIGSWCGKKFVPAKVAARPGFAEVPAVASGWLREIKSTLILQPGPAALTDGLDALAGNHHRMGRKPATAHSVAERCYAKPRDERMRTPTAMQPNKARADLWMDLALVAFLIGFDVAARLLPHAPGVWPVAASALFAGRMLRMPALALIVPLAAMAAERSRRSAGDDWRVTLVVYAAITLPALRRHAASRRWRGAVPVSRPCCRAR